MSKPLNLANMVDFKTVRIKQYLYTVNCSFAEISPNGHIRLATPSLLYRCRWAMIANS